MTARMGASRQRSRSSPRRSTVMRLSPWPLAAAVLALATPAAADSFIGFTDNGPQSSSQYPLSETDSNWAVRWTQTVATHDVTVRALLDAHGADTTGNWWITT